MGKNKDNNESTVNYIEPNHRSERVREIWMCTSKDLGFYLLARINSMKDRTLDHGGKVQPRVLFQMESKCDVFLLSSLNKMDREREGLRWSNRVVNPMLHFCW